MNTVTVVITIYNEPDKEVGQVLVKGTDLSFTPTGDLKNISIQVLESKNVIKSNSTSNAVTLGLRYHFSKLANQPIVGKVIDVVRDFIVNVIYK